MVDDACASCGHARSRHELDTWERWCLEDACSCRRFIHGDDAATLAPVPVLVEENH